jgi:hypothetical protein
MKRCQKCNFQSDAMLDYCWQCGSQLNDFSNAGQFYQGAARTQNFNIPNQYQGFNNYGYTNAPKYQPRANSFSYGRIAAVLGGFFFVLLLITGAGAAVVYRAIYISCAKCTPPTPKPMPIKEPEPIKNDQIKTDPVKNNPVTDDKDSDKPRTEFEKIWVDYNVRENGRLGMRIHAKFSVYNMKGVDSEMVVLFEKADGTKLKSTAKTYSSKGGQVAAYRSMKPGYDDTIYKDLDVFMPYDELKLSRGKYDLKMDVDVIYENGDLIGHLTYHDFQYEKF